MTSGLQKAGLPGLKDRSVEMLSERAPAHQADSGQDRETRQLAKLVKSWASLRWSDIQAISYASRRVAWLQSSEGLKTCEFTSCFRFQVLPSSEVLRPQDLSRSGWQKRSAFGMPEAGHCHFEIGSGACARAALG